MLPRVVPLLFTLFLFSFLAPSIASAWFVVNESTLDLDGRVLDVADGFNEFLTFTVNSASSINCPFNQSPCNPPLSVDSELIVLLTSTDGESFECELDMRGNGVVAVRSQDRDSPLPANLYCFSINAGNLEDASDPFALDAEKGTLAPMTAVNRSIRFFASGDPQYNNADIGSSGNTSGAAADSDFMLAIIRNETTADNSIRGVIVNGDLTQNARGDNDGNPFQSSDELEAYMRATATEQHMFFEGLGNHDVESTGGTSAPEDMIEFVRDTSRETPSDPGPRPAATIRGTGTTSTSSS